MIGPRQNCRIEKGKLENRVFLEETRHRQHLMKRCEPVSRGSSGDEKKDGASVIRGLCDPWKGKLKLKWSWVSVKNTTPTSAPCCTLAAQVED